MGREGSIESQQKTDLFWSDIMPYVQSCLVLSLFQRTTWTLVCKYKKLEIDIYVIFSLVVKSAPFSNLLLFCCSIILQKRCKKTKSSYIKFNENWLIECLKVNQNPFVSIGNIWVLIYLTLFLAAVWNKMLNGLRP